MSIGIMVCRAYITRQSRFVLQNDVYFGRARNGSVKKRLTRRARGRLDSHRQIGFFVALGFFCFESDSRPASRR